MTTPPSSKFSDLWLDSIHSTSTQSLYFTSLLGNGPSLPTTDMLLPVITLLSMGIHRIRAWFWVTLLGGCWPHILQKVQWVSGCLLCLQEHSRQESQGLSWLPCTHRLAGLSEIKQSFKMWMLNNGENQSNARIHRNLQNVFFKKKVVTVKLRKEEK